ncbi:MAG: BPTI/Kunitz domain-containing protein [Campylobacterota bacterium]|nr:BPTI/Kunitz domain-containing protein [Campylobacterota bacterium]
MKSFLVIIMAFFSGCMASPDTKEKKVDSRCLQKGESGRCRAAIPRYHFNQESGECEQFIWGGCGGVVPFETIESCKATCS